MDYVKIILIIILALVMILFFETFDNQSLVAIENQYMERPSDKFIIVTEVWEPYNTIDHDGLTDRVVLESCALEDLQVEIRFYPWERCLEMVKAGVATATYPWAMTESRLPVYDFSLPLIRNVESLFYLNGLFDGMTPQDIFADPNNRIGLMSGYYHAELIHPATSDFSVNEKNAIEKLINGRIDALVLSRYNAIYILKEYYPEYLPRLNSVSGIMEELELHLIIDEDNDVSQVFLKRFNDGLSKLIASGRYEEILKLYEGEIND